MQLSSNNPFFKLLQAFLLTLLASFLMLGALSSAQAEDDLLEVDDAFSLQTPSIQDNQIQIEWKIAPDYKLYKDKLSVSADSITLGTPSYSKAKEVNDALFGKTEIYAGNALITVPYTLTSPNAQSVNLTVQYQGCADKIGVCYPPQTRTLKIDLPATNTNAPLPSDATQSNANNSAFGSLAALNDLLQADSGQPELLAADDAFQFTSEVKPNGEVVVSWNIAPDYHLYKDKIKVTLKDGSATLGELSLPAAEQIDDPLFGKTAVYHGRIQATLPITAIQQRATLELEFQGCSASAGVCYPPMKKPITVTAEQINATAHTAQASGEVNNNAIATAKVVAVEQSETDRITDTLKTSSVWIVITTFFIFGLLLAFTPCVFPMIPILSSIIVGQGDKLTTQRAFVMSLVYVLAMSVTYTVAGVLAGIFGENLQAAFQNPWIIGSFSLLFVLLAFSMFGFFELQLPSSLQSKLTNMSNKQKGGTLTGVAVMGFLSALIVGPCVAPPLAGALIYIGQTGDALLGGIALFAMSMGMGLPLLLLGTSAGKLLPRAGAWMDSVKAVFGVMLLGIALWMLERIVPSEVTMLGWALLFIVSAIYLGALESSQSKSGWFKLFKGLGFALLLYGVMILVGLFGGSKDMLQPLKVFQGGQHGANVEATHLNFKTIKSVEDLEAELAKGQPVMLDFYADWCVSCKEMEKLTFTDATVQNGLKGVTLLQADVTLNDATDKALMKKFGLIGPPAILFFDHSGKEQTAQRVVGFKPAEQFIDHIHKAYP